MLRPGRRNALLLSVLLLPTAGNAFPPAALRASHGLTVAGARTANASAGGVLVAVRGELRQWHEVTLDGAGPSAHERDTAPSPFLDYRLTVTFEHESGAPRYLVSGYFAADGRAAETGAEAGAIWRAHLSPDKPGRWRYRVAFVRGPGIAVSDEAGEPVPPLDGAAGWFDVKPTDKTGRDFRAKGRLRYVGGHYLRFAGTGEHFLKAGPDSPETVLASADFDGTNARRPDVPLKTWAPHVRDWREADPTWRGGRGKGLIGALNYLAAQGLNSLSFLTYNAGGDGDNVWPFVDRDDKLHYDCSKLDQWGIVFAHAQRLGLHLHFKLQETENDDQRQGRERRPVAVPEALDGGALGAERKLYLRELIARFGHHLALTWNLGEENTQTAEEQRAVARFVDDIDPYGHHRVVHTYPDEQDRVYQPLLGSGSALTGASLQNAWNATHARTYQWVTASARAGRPWVVSNDEQGPASLGVPPDPGYEGFTGIAGAGDDAYDLHDIRRYTLWGSLMAGGAGVDYYFGYRLPHNDLVAEDYRSRERTWGYARVALEFLAREQVPYWAMRNADDLVLNPARDNSRYCLALPGELYLVYLPRGGAATLDLSAAAGEFSVAWLDPRKGGRAMPVRAVRGGARVALAAPTSDDWLAIVRSRRPLSTLSVADPRCEGLREAAQVDTSAPRFSWRLVAEGRDVRQAAYQLRVTEVDGHDRPLAPALESPRIASDESQWVTLPAFAPKPRAAYTWQVRVWDNRDNASDWSEPHRFGTGLLGERWPADWIGDGRTLPLFQTAPARHFRGTFQLERLPVRARLFVTALGLVEPWLNGRKITEDLFVPGWPDYRRRVFYAAFDVTRLLRSGDNTLGMILGDGWYSGTMIPRHQFGQQAMLSAFLDLTDEEGRSITVTTGEAWRWTDAGPITMNSIYHGETYDARRELSGWSDPRASADEEGWRPVDVRAGRHTPAVFTARISPAVRRIESLVPAAVNRRGADVHIYDLGQNMTGWVRLRLEAEAGREIKLRFAEMLEQDGSLHTANLRSARANALYIAKGEGVEEWEPRFTYFGFRYVELSGVQRPRPDAIQGVVVHTDLPRTGEFESSNPLLDRLFRNTLWSQKGNFLELPTDCPQRDERAGWTGDAQVFAPTALYNMDAGAFFRQWLFSLRDGLRDDARAGGYPDVAPFTGFGHGSPGWAEAGVIVPWTVWLHTGDRRVLAENLPAIQHALELMAQQAPDGIRLSPPAWGDWLAPGYPRYKSPPRQDLIATAYYAHAADLAARIADVLGRPELAAANRVLFEKARAAYQRAFIAPDGRVADDVQTSYLLTFSFDLAPPAQRAQIANHLVRTFAEKDNHLATGFLGTPLIAPVLTSIGRQDLAYTVLQKTTYPGWLFSVSNGATTIWERWDSWTPEQGFHKEGMNSFNHYAYGSVVSWFYDTIAGLQPLPEAPGWKRFRIAPLPGGALTHAVGRIQTPHGEASSAWRIENGRLSLSVGIPPNTRGDVVLPAQSTVGVLLDGVPLDRHGLARVTGHDTGRPIVTLSSGRYEFVVAAEARLGSRHGKALHPGFGARDVQR
jgi:hypothetical protein